jgi:hypothetical protein
LDYDIAVDSKYNLGQKKIKEKLDEVGLKS